MEFVLYPDAIKIFEGKYIKGQYFPESKTIFLYTILIKDKDDLRDVIIHELGHHFGWKHK